MEPEYWTLNREKVKELITDVQILGEGILKDLTELRLNDKHPYSIWKLKTKRGWIGCTIEKVENNQRIVIWISLNHEEPIEFTAGLRYWDKHDPNGTCVDLFKNSYQELKAIDIYELKTSIIQSLKRIPIFPETSS